MILKWAWEKKGWLVYAQQAAAIAFLLFRDIMGSSVFIVVTGLHRGPLCFLCCRGFSARMASNFPSVQRGRVFSKPDVGLDLF